MHLAEKLGKYGTFYRQLLLSLESIDFESENLDISHIQLHSINQDILILSA